jgi:hypothetical protein
MPFQQNEWRYKQRLAKYKPGSGNNSIFSICNNTCSSTMPNEKVTLSFRKSHVVIHVVIHVVTPFQIQINRNLLWWFDSSIHRGSFVLHQRINTIGYDWFEFEGVYFFEDTLYVDIIFYITIQRWRQGRSEGVLEWLTPPPQHFRINIFGKSGGPFGKLRQ